MNKAFVLSAFTILNMIYTQCAEERCRLAEAVAVIWEHEQAEQKIEGVESKQQRLAHVLKTAYIDPNDKNISEAERCIEQGAIHLNSKKWNDNHVPLFHLVFDGYSPAFTSKKSRKLHDRLIRKVFECGADICVTDYLGTNALMLAAYKGSESTVGWMIKNQREKVEGIINNQLTIEDYRFTCSKSTALLLTVCDHCPRLDWQEKDTQQTKRQVKIARSLIAAKGDVHVQDGHGKSFLDYAGDRNCTPLFQALAREIREKQKEEQKK